LSIFAFSPPPLQPAGQSLLPGCAEFAKGALCGQNEGLADSAAGRHCSQAHLAAILPTKAEESMQATKLQAWRAHRQGLDGRIKGQPPDHVIEKTGWLRTMGDANPCLALFARARISREQTDRAVAALEICELPSARGCTYVVPASDFGLALSVAHDFSGVEMKTAEKLGVTDAEIDALCEEIIQLLEEGPLETREIREEVDHLVTDLGEEGKKKGLPSTLPVALGQLQVLGYIRREPVSGRLDQQRYRYALWETNPRPDRPANEEDWLELARRFFHWIGPASLGEFQWFSGLGVRAAKAAVAELRLVPLEKEDPRLMLPEDHQLFCDFQTPPEPSYALVGSLDGIIHLRRDVRGLLAPEDAARTAYTEKGPMELGKLPDLNHHAILDRGRLVGLWEFDPASGSVIWQSFVEKTEALVRTVKETEEFVREQLGDARLYSMDTPKGRLARIESLLSRHAANEPGIRDR
jgi:hypothetical protein